MQVCPQCQSDRLVNNGSAAGKPKQLCRHCGYQFTRPTPHGKPLAMKVHAVLLYLSGLSMHRIAFLLRVSVQSVLNWLRTFAQEHDETPEPKINTCANKPGEKNDTTTVINLEIRHKTETYRSLRLTRTARLMPSAG